MANAKKISLSYNNLNTLVREKKSYASEPDYNMIKSEKGRVDSLENYDMTRNEILNDDEIRGFISIITDSVIRMGYTLEGNNDRNVKKAEKMLHDLKFRKLLKKIVPNMIAYNHAFVEIDNNNVTKKPVNLYIVDVERIKPKQDVKGRVQGWYYKMPDEAGNNVDYKLLWKPEEIAHFDMDNFSPTFWGVSNIETLKDIIKLKKRVMEYITLIFDQNWLKPHFHGKDIPDRDLSSFLEMIYTGMQKEARDLPLVTVGSEDMEANRYMTEDFVTPLISLLAMLRNRILTLFRVPPIIAGTVDNSNRSNSEIQARFAFMNRIKAITEEIEDDCEFDLFPKLGLDGVSIKFGNVDVKELRDYVDIAVLLMNAGGYKEPMLKWLKSKGYDLPDDLFPTIEDEKSEKESNQEMSETKIDKNSNLQSSRQPQDNFQK